MHGRFEVADGAPGMDDRAKVLLRERQTFGLQKLGEGDGELGKARRSSDEERIECEADVRVELARVDRVLPGGDERGGLRETRVRRWSERRR